MPAPIAFVIAMPMELVPLRRALGLQRQATGDAVEWIGERRGRPVVAVVTGMGTARARLGTERLLGRVQPERVVVVGITGAADDDTPLGTVVRPAVVVDGLSGAEFRPAPLGPGEPNGTMWTSDSLITDPYVLAELRRRGVVSLDMETAAVAATCEELGVVWSVVRAVSDRATDGSVDDDVLAMSRQDGTPNLSAVARYVVRHPARLPSLARMASASRLATQRAVEAALAGLDALAGPDDRASS